MKREILQYVAWICLLLAVKSMAATHYVVTNGTPGVTSTDPYISWATAGSNIIDVVKAAMTNSAPRVVWVTNGTYYFTNGVNVTNNVTIQSVHGRSNTIFNGNYPAKTNYAFYINNPVATTTSILDGFTITNFYYADYATIQLERNASIRNCLITGNNGTYKSGSAGGGIAMTYVSEVINCIVKGNYAGSAGGIYMTGAGQNKVLDTLIENNSAIWGGGVRIGDNAADVTISNCYITKNSGSSGGGIYLTGDKQRNSIINCVIGVNTAIGRPGYPGYGRGGGIYSTGTNNLLIKNCMIQSNTAPDAGGGVYMNVSVLRNCLITDNTANTNGGGIYCQTGIVENCTIVSNHATAVASAGGGIYMDAAGGSVTGLNNIVYYNTAASAANFTNAQGNTNLSYNCVFPAVNGTGNITTDPGLIDLAGGNYRLIGASPCIDSGINQNWMTNAYDLDGRPRIGHGVVNMGAYETIRNGTIICGY